MKITLTGSLGHISKPLAQTLIAAGHDITIISHSDERAADIVALGATPAIGSIADGAFLTQAFTGADAVYLMITAANNDADVFAAGRQQAETYANAVKAAGVKQVVNLSSVGANLGPEVGALHIYNIIESVLTHELPNVNLTFLRPTAMFYNLFSNLTTLKQDHAIYTNSSLTKPNSWVAPADIVPVAASALTSPAAGITSQYVASDEKSYTEVAAYLSHALGFDVKLVQISDDTMEQNLRASGAPASFAHQYVKMTAYERDNDFYADYRAHQPVLGPSKLADFVKEFAHVYQK
ncbi:NmrA family NAD(P)-binding protein [Levilactobacillus fujinensis]|uniref:NAD(P)H-binding protein n=1 Tax=Levilactobacillus fujinensis TaxID=2486024 RepID=A0ABW1THN4_9LACO|nr:NAD(P)H-binding protein [Levilactobacillus fujinensis]